MLLKCANWEDFYIFQGIWHLKAKRSFFSALHKPVGNPVSLKLRLRANCEGQAGRWGSGLMCLNVIWRFTVTSACLSVLYAFCLLFLAVFHQLYANESMSDHVGFARVFIELINENDNRPIFSKPLYNISLPENTPPGTSLLQILVSSHTDYTHWMLQITHWVDFSHDFYNACFIRSKSLPVVFHFWLGPLETSAYVGLFMATEARLLQMKVQGCG